MAGTSQAQLTVVSTTPLINAGNVSRTSPIVVDFDQPVDPTTFAPANFKAFGKWTGPVNGALTFSNGNQRVTLTPARPYQAGENVLLMMSHGLLAADGTPLRSGGYTLSFTCGVNATPKFFRHRATITDRDSTGSQTRIYGGLACDLNLDGWSDLTIINEVSQDIRVLMNRGDGSGLFAPMLTPYTPIPVESSPNEPADFNGDGFVDIVTSSNQTNQIAVCLGNGNGTFQAARIINVGGYPRGFAIIDVDGDGDMDILVAQAASNNILRLLNDGAGVFSSPTTFEGGVDGEYGMVAADMNNDGLPDLVVGGVNSNTVGVLRNNGNGTFTPTGSRAVAGGPWVVVAGDVNGDRRLDIASANSFGNTASMLIGNGNATLQAATNVPTSGHTVAVDLVDIDGDGDADWIISSFGGGRWHVLTNSGLGVFTPFREFIAPANPSCCLPADFDNDGDVDLALIDEIADVVVMMANSCPGDFNDDSDVNPDDLGDYITCYFSMPPCELADVNDDGEVNPDDLGDFITTYFTPC